MERSTVQSCLAAPFKINDLAAIFQNTVPLFGTRGSTWGSSGAKSALQALIRARKRPKTEGESSPRHKDSLAPANCAVRLALGGLAGLKSHREGPKCRWFTAP